MTPAAAEPVLQIAFGTVRHRRLRPRPHAFGYRAFFLRIRVDASPASVRWGGLTLLGIDRPGLLSFRSRDHGDGSADPRAWLAALLATAGLTADGPIWLHTFARVLGYAFKPVSFWHCHRADGRLVAIVAEVNNTFGDRRAYLLHDDGRPLREGQEIVARKDFHVSPFCQTAGLYRFRFLHRDARWVARIDHDDAAGPLLCTSLSGTLVAADARAAARALLGYPLFSLGVIARIHWQAIRLWRQGVPFVRRPTPPPSPISAPAQGHPAARTESA